MLIQELDVIEALTHFNLELYGPVKTLEGGEDNLNLQVTTDKGDIVLRRYDISGFTKAKAELEYIMYLANEGYPTPCPIRTFDEQLLTTCNNRPVAAFPFVEGTVPSVTREDLAYQIGQLQGNLHVLGQKCEGNLPQLPRLESLKKILEQSNQLAGWQKWLTLVSSFLDKNFDFLEGVLREIPSGPIHHDLHRKNTIVQNDYIRAVIDFDEINYAPFVIDLLRTCHYIAGESSNRQLNSDLARRLLEGYLAVRELENLEREVMSNMFDLVNLVDAADFLRDPPSDVTSVDECRSLQIYYANQNYEFGGLF